METGFCWMGLQAFSDGRDMVIFSGPGEKGHGRCRRGREGRGTSLDRRSPSAKRGEGGKGGHTLGSMKVWGQEATGSLLMASLSSSISLTYFREMTQTKLMISAPECLQSQPMMNGWHLLSTYCVLSAFMFHLM